MRLDDTLEAFFSRQAPLAHGDGIVAAFSGGSDSTALLLGLTRLARRHRLRLTAAHLDHGLDPDSAARAAASERLAGDIGVPLVVERREVPGLRRRGESAEAAARRVRYAFLEEVRRRFGALWVATAHHRDDQAETVLLRLLFASGPEGLAGIRYRWGAVVRPLLDLPRSELLATVQESGLDPVDDPTNRDLSLPRGLLRHRLLPRLQEEIPGAVPRLARLATRAAGARRHLRERLAELLRPHRVAGGFAVSRSDFLKLPAALRPSALALIHERAGATYPAGTGAREELLRQLATGPHGRLGCDCGGGWRWEGRGERLALVRRDPPVPSFTYTLEVPGVAVVPETGARVRLRRASVAPWMFKGSRHRAGLALSLDTGDRVVIRNRRPGDRLRPLGAAGSRRLKEVLIDHRVPRRERDRIPLLVVGGHIAWVPGVTVDERFRLAEGGSAWVAELLETS